MTTNQPRSGPDRPGTVLSVLGMIGVALHLQPVPLLELLALIPPGILLLMGLRRTTVQAAAHYTWRHIRWSERSTGCPVTGDLANPRRRKLPVPPLLAVDSGPLQRLGPSLRSARRQEPPGPGALPGPRPDGDDRHGLGPGHGPVPGFRGGDRPGRSRGDHLLRDRLPDRRDDRPGHGRDGLPAS